MIYPVIRALREWTSDPNTGPNAYLPDVTREADDAALEVPPFAAVLDAYTDEEVFAATEPGRYPALLWTAASEVEVEGEVNVGELNGNGSFTVAARIVVEEITGPTALRMLDYLLTALNRSVTAFLADDAAGSAARQRRHCQIISCTARSYGLAFEALGAAKVGAILALTFSIRDIEAS